MTHVIPTIARGTGDVVDRSISGYVSEQGVDAQTNGDNDRHHNGT